MKFRDFFNRSPDARVPPLGTPAGDAAGTKEWSRNGERHRDDGPAIEFANGDKLWYNTGKLHREDGPAVEYANSTKAWWREGKLHRDDGAAVESASGTREWYRNGQRHRDDGPAIEYASGDKAWYLNGQPSTAKEIAFLQSRPLETDQLNDEGHGESITAVMSKGVSHAMAPLRTVRFKR